MDQKKIQKQLYSKLLPEIITYVFFASFIFIYLLKVIHPELLYFKLQPFFTTDNAYIEFHKNYRLGFVSIIAQFILQFLAFPFAGAIILTLVFLFFTFLLRITLIKPVISKLNGIEFIPAVLILLSLKNYTEAVNTAIIFGICSIFILVNHLLKNQKLYFKIPYVLLAVFTSYFVFGFPATFMVFIGLVSYELVNRTHYKVLLSLIFVNLIAISYLYFFIDSPQMVKLFFKEASEDNKYAQLPVFWEIIYYFIIIVLLSLILNLEFIDKALDKASVILPKQWYFIILFIIITGISFKKRFLNENKYAVMIDYYAYEKNWNKVIKLKSHLSHNDRISRFQMNRALYHTGKMSENLFSIPQEWAENGLILTNNATRECTINSSDLFFDMGFINGSRYWAYEAQTFNQYSPRIIQRLAITNMILEDHYLAKKYLLILNNSLIYNKWAQKYLAFYDKRDSSELKKALSVFHKIKSDSVRFINNNFPARDLVSLMKNNPDDKMVFEYLISYSLLRNELNSFAHFMRFSNHYKKNSFLPKTYEEAMIFFYFKKKIDPLTQYFKISNECIARFNNFNKTLKDYKMNKDMAHKDLHRYFGDTFWYYIAYEIPKMSK